MFVNPLNTFFAKKEGSSTVSDKKKTEKRGINQADCLKEADIGAPDAVWIDSKNAIRDLFWSWQIFSK